MDDVRLSGTGTEEVNPGLAIMKVIERAEMLSKEIPENQKAALMCVEMMLSVVVAYQGWVNSLEKKVQELTKKLN